MPHRQKLEQGRAKHAFDAAQSVATKEKEELKKEYKSYTKKVPMLIKTNGLGNTLAFMEAKGKAYGIILHNLDSWLKHDITFSALYANLHGQSLVEKSINCATMEYRMLTIEILAYLSWLKRFADGLIKD